MHRLLVATNNAGKLAEYKELLRGLDLELISLSDAGIDCDVPETGATYSENAILKARTYARLSGMLSLADDSGLEVEALGGRPGIESKRHAGEGATDADRIIVLLEQLSAVPAPERRARFVCVIAIATPGGMVRTAEGLVEGRIDSNPRGTNGFGYDPIFYLPSLGKTMAELSSSEKNRVSHRAMAAKGAKRILTEMLAASN